MASRQQALGPEGACRRQGSPVGSLLRARSSVFLLLGVVLVLGIGAVSAQQGLVEGRLYQRSDGSLWLYSGGQLHAVAPLQVDDATLDAVPTGEPLGERGLLPIPLAATDIEPLTAEGGLTPEPLGTVGPAAAVTPVGVTGEELAYLAGFNILTRDVALHSARLARLLSDAAEDPSIAQSDNWRAEVMLSVVTIRTTYTRAQTLTPPASLQEVHAKLIEGLGKADAGAGHITGALTSGNADEFRQGLEEMAASATSIREASELVEAWGAARASGAPTPTVAPTEAGADQPAGAEAAAEGQ